MGRGRAKAKQTKVARELKYTTTGTDLERLRAELTGAPPPATPNGAGADEVDGLGGDPAGDYADELDADGLDADELDDDEAEPGTGRSYAG